MKNVKDIKLQLSGIKVSLCFGKPAFLKFHKETTGDEYNGNFDGVAGRVETLVYPSGAKRYAIYISDASKDIYDIKATLVHEITHVATFIMEYTHIDNDEYRAYLTDYLYLIFVKYIDKKISKKNKKKP